MDQTRKTALAAREQVLAATKSEVEAEVTAATTRLRAEADEARGRLSADAEALANAIAERVLDRKVS